MEITDSIAAIKWDCPMEYGGELLSLTILAKNLTSCFLNPGCKIGMKID